MSVIVISNSTFLESFQNEAQQINALFEAGLPFLHLRKPDSTESDLKSLLEAIDARFYSQIVVHQHFETAQEFGITRWHLTEYRRKVFEQENTEGGESCFSKKGISLSTSIHRLEDYENLSIAFDYTFLSPVFDSISKKGYAALPINAVALQELRRLSSTKIVALGGISSQNCSKALEMGFDGVAVFGSIWQNENPLIELKNLLKQIPI